MNQRSSLTWVDYNGFTRINSIATEAGVGAIRAACRALSNAANAACWEGDWDIYSVVPNPAPYRTGQVTATLDFICSDGTQAQVPIFAPKLGIFLADGRTIDVSNADVQTLINACVVSTSRLLSATGSTASLYAGGFASGRGVF